MGDKVTRKLNAIKRKTRKIKKANKLIQSESAKLRKRLGDKKYEDLRTGNVKLGLQDSKTVQRINRAYEAVGRKKKAIKRKLSKIGMLNYQGDK